MPDHCIQFSKKHADKPCGMRKAANYMVQPLEFLLLFLWESRDSLSGSSDIAASGLTRPTSSDLRLNFSVFWDPNQSVVDSHCQVRKKSDGQIRQEAKLSKNCSDLRDNRFLLLCINRLL